jgi:hypothetical protein
MQHALTAGFLVASIVLSVPLHAQQMDSTSAQRTAAALNSQTSVPLIIPAGTPLKVTLERDISSASVNVGDTVTFRMTADYSEYNHVLIAEGTRVRGIVAQVDRRSAGGDPGNVTLKVKSVRAVDGHRIPLTGSKSVKGKDRRSQATVLGILTLGIGGTKKGLSAVMPTGTVVTVYTAAPATIVVPR